MRTSCVGQSRIEPRVGEIFRSSSFIRNTSLQVCVIPTPLILQIPLLNQTKISLRPDMAGLHKRCSKRGIRQTSSLNSTSRGEARRDPLEHVCRTFYFIYSFPILDLLSHRGYDSKIASGRENQYLLSSDD